MKKRMLSILLIGTMVISLSACGGGGVSQEEYDKVVAERDEYKALLEEIGAGGNGTSSGQLQSEWIASGGADNMDNGYEIVDSIDIDTDEVTVKYTNYEIVDSTDGDGNPIKRLIVYCDFTNKMSVAMSSSNAFSSIAYQDGIELQGWGGAEELNDTTSIKDGAKINVGFMFDLNNTETPVEFNLSNGLWFEGTQLFAQQQEIALQ